MEIASTMVAILERGQRLGRFTCQGPGVLQEGVKTSLFSRSARYTMGAGARGAQTSSLEHYSYNSFFILGTVKNAVFPVAF